MIKKFKARDKAHAYKPSMWRGEGGCQEDCTFDLDSETTKIYVTPNRARNRIKLKMVLRKELKVRAEMSETQPEKQKNQQRLGIFLKIN